MSPFVLIDHCRFKITLHTNTSFVVGHVESNQNVISAKGFMSKYKIPFAT